MEVFSFISAYWAEISTLIYIVNILFIINIIYIGRDSRSTFAWIFLILLLPGLGLVGYLIFGRVGPRKSKKILAQEKLLQAHLRNMIEDHHADQKRERALFNKRGFSKRYKKIFNLASKNPEALLSSSNNVNVLYKGKEKYAKLYEDIKNAKNFVHLAYFIWRDDDITKKFVDLLEKKVKEGVEVRIFLDYIGSFWLTPFFYNLMLKRRGIKVCYFSAMYSSTQFHTINYRNHMKIAVIDGKIAYTGGMNMGKEYEGRGSLGFWRDTHLRIEGEAASIYNAVFLAFWHKVSKEKFPDKKYFPKVKRIKGNTIQVVGSGIDINWSSMENLLLNMIVNARKTIYIQSPYFIPSESILTALKVAALSGVKVNLMVTGKPDKYMPYWAAFNFYPDLLKAGVKVYHYNKGFMHSKTIVIDKEVSIVGSTNLDIRSFKLNYELGTVLYDFRLSRELASQFKKDVRHSKRFTTEDYKRMNFLVRFRNSFFRLFTPLL